MEQVGPYKLASVLGRGGMGTVYKAVHVDSGEELAVKVLSPSYSDDSHFRSRFGAEIKALLKLDHPNIVRLISYGQEDHNLYFAMELVDGRSLFQLQRDGKRFDWREVIRIAKNISLGLRHAHDRGVIHRDLKPGNLLRANSGIVKIADFGIAKRFGQDQNTGTNVLGTVDFMSPEQAKGLPVSARSDLYSLGTVMFTLLAGRPPFSANSFEESIRNLTQVPAPRIKSEAPNVPPALDQLIAQLLAKDPEQRVPTALALYHQLKEVERNLRDDSQAKTAERSEPRSAGKTTGVGSPSTSVDTHRKSGRTDHRPSGRKPAAKQTDTNENQDDSSTKSDTVPIDSRSEDGDLLTSHDFFTPVTREQRSEQTQAELDHVRRTSPLQLAVYGFLLLAVLGTAAYGIHIANRLPTAEALLQKIERSRERPYQRMSEIRLFLEHYPQHERAAWVTELRALAPAIQKVNYLSARRNKVGLLSPIEQEFLSIVDLADSDGPKAEKQLKAFLTLYRDDESLGEADRESVTAASIWSIKLARDAKAQTRQLRQSIQRQFERADGLPVDEAVALYDSIVALNQDFEWVADLVDQARDRINRLKQN